MSSDQTFRRLLTMDQLTMLQHWAAIVLPVEFRSEWMSELDPAERQAREVEAERGLVGLGFASAGDTPLADRLAPPIAAWLSLFANPATVVTVRAWNHERTIIQTIAMVAGFAAQLIRTQRRGLDGPANEDAVEFAAYAVTELTAQLMRASTLGGDDVPGAAEPRWATLPMTDMQAIVDALYTGDAGLVEAVARRQASLASVIPIDRAAEAIDGGYVVAVVQGADAPRASRNWFHGNRGWFELSVDAVTVHEPVTLAEHTRVQVTKADRSTMTAGVALVAAGLVGGFHG